MKYIFDGAFGTYYSSLAGEPRPPELACVQDAETVLEVHRRYIGSGANAIKTDTYGANTGVYGDMELVKSILRAGWRLAGQAAAERSVTVFADIGPIAAEYPAAEYLEIADTFLAEGAGHFLFETLPDTDGVLEAVRHIRETRPSAEIIVSFAVSQDGRTAQGEYYLSLFDRAVSAGADMVGLNCVCGPAHILRLIKKCDTGRYRISAMPNAGYPALVGGRTVYNDNPEYFAEKLLELSRCGVEAVGGCCGTTPEHIRAFTRRLSGESPIPQVRVSAPYRAETPVFASRPIGAKLRSIAVELDAPFDTNAEPLLEGARQVLEAGADFITIPDSPLARPRADSLMLSTLVRRELGAAMIPHLSCRDKNQIAIRGQLIAGHLEGLRHVLAVTGDPVPQTDRSAAKGVFGFNSYKLIRFIASLNEELLSDEPYSIYAALNVTRENFDSELHRAEQKLQNGANAFMTQPVYTDAHLNNLRLAKERLGCPILAGIMPVAGYKNAVFLNNEVAGVEIPSRVVDSLRDKSRDEAREISVAFCRELIDGAADCCDGYYLMTPLRRVDIVLDLIQHIRSVSS